MLAACLLASWQVAAEAQLAAASGARTALVVGNGAYAGELPALRNPVNDARLMARTLQTLGFQVTLVENADEDDLESAVVAFGDALRRAQGGVGLFYYAGHGVQWRGANYLIPVGARVESERHLRTRTVSAELVLAEMEDAQTALNIVVLDACRDNPWAVSGKRSIGGSRGLSRMDVPTGSASSFWLAYSAAAGQAAEDGEGDNSQYTEALALAMGTPGLELEDVFKEAGRTVAAATAGRQKPWTEGSWYGRFFFAPQASESAARPVAPALAGNAPAPATEMWLQIRETRDAQLLERYLATYPDSPYVLAAQARLAELRGQPFTVLVEPSIARVRVLNIEPPYRAGMQLPAGQYRVEASAEGHETQVETVAHGGSPTRHRMALRKVAVGPKIGERFRDCAECPQMVVVPAGSFEMGSPSYEEGRASHEGPLRDVTIAVPFAMGVYEVTVGEFRRFVRATGHSTGDSCWIQKKEGGWRKQSGLGWRDPGFRQDDSHPVVCVNWDDVQAYARWLSAKTGKRYRLPSESEWEYAARAGTRTPFSTGETISADQANYRGDQTVPVGTFGANPWGLHDVHGNVWEFTEDCSYGSYAGAPTNGSAWKGGDCSDHAIRGGAWNSSGPGALRSARRGSCSATRRDNDCGFRMARTLTP